MATKPSKTTSETSCTASLSATRLKKLSVNTILSPEESGTGRLHLTVTTQRLPKEDEKTVVIRLGIKGEGLSGNEKTSDQVAFTIEAAIEGIFALSRKPKVDELKGRESDLTGYLMPILSDMVETLLSKCGYIGISLPRSFPFKPAPAAKPAPAKKPARAAKLKLK